MKPGASAVRRVGTPESAPSPRSSRPPLAPRVVPKRASRRSLSPLVTPSQLLYLYCIVESGSPAHLLLTERRVSGLVRKEPLFPLEAGGLVAAVSRVPAATFQERPLNELLTELPRIAPFALRHEEAVRALLSGAPALLPISLGAIYRTPQRVVALLRKRAAEFRRLLDQLRDKREWGLKVFMEPGHLAEATLGASAQLRQLTEEAARSTPGRAYMLRKRRERLLTVEARRLSELSLDTILQRLIQASAAVSVEQLPAVQSGTTPLVLKAAFLVEASRTDAFRAAAAELQTASISMGFKLELDGPWAPYSFVGQRHDQA